MEGGASDFAPSSRYNIVVSVYGVFKKLSASHKKEVYIWIQHNKTNNFRETFLGTKKQIFKTPDMCGARDSQFYRIETLYTFKHF